MGRSGAGKVRKGGSCMTLDKEAYRRGMCGDYDLNVPTKDISQSLHVSYNVEIPAS